MNIETSFVDMTDPAKVEILGTLNARISITLLIQK